MKPIYKIYITAVALALLAIGTIGGSAWSNYKIGKLEAAVRDADQIATESRRRADEKEKEAEIYKAKTEYLERQIADSKAAARKQDERIKTQTTNTARARRDVERARGVRSIDTDERALCAKLASLGHPCG